MDAHDHCAAILRARDRDRYVADLFAPEAARPHLFALHAFTTEIARVRDVVSDPTLGEIRLTWWRDALAEADGQGHPVATALLETIDKFSLPQAGFEMLLDARRFDLYDDLMPSLDDLEAYAGGTASVVLKLGAAILCDRLGPAADEAAGHGGVAETLTEIMTMLPAHSARGQCHLPADLMAAHGLDRDSLHAGRDTLALRSLLVELRSLARTHLAKADDAIAGLPAETKPAFLPLALIAPTLDRMDRPGHRPLSDRALLAPWRRLWVIRRAARRG